jgi:hypothetical protein
MTRPLKMPAVLVSAFEAGVDQETATLHARLRGLRTFARRVFIDRNAAGMPPAYRDRIKAATRPHHRQAIVLLRASRTALLAGNVAQWELLATKACAKLEHVQVLFREPTREEKAKVLQTLDKVNAQSKGNPRPDRRSELRQRVINVMKGGRSSDTEFKDFVASWVGDRHIDGVAIELQPSGKYTITDQSEGDGAPADYTWGTLQKMYSEAG